MSEQPAPGFGELLRQLRADADLTQEELAEAARLSPRSVSDLERGISRTARKDTAVLLAGALSLTGAHRELFIAAARGRAPVAEVLAARQSATVTSPAPLTNLPVELSAFIGRDRELAEVRALIVANRLVTLTGAGGCGKTRLGLQAAAGLLDGADDGVWLVELAVVTDADGVAPAVCGALRLAAQPGRPALDSLLDALEPQDVLIVLDNCEHLIGGCASTAEAILRRCPRAHLIATSREPLGIGGETIYRVPSLSLPGPEDSDSGPAAVESSDAVALFSDRARAYGIHLSLPETGPLVASVCRRLDGMPLAIELAAARMRSMSLAELHDRLDQRFRLLTGGSRTALERQQTLRATVGWSYSLLTGAEQLLLGRLSVFAGGFGLDAAEAVCGSGGIDVLEVAGLLGSLVDKSLVVADQTGGSLRYRLLETIRLFAAERLAEAGDAEAAAVSAAHCAHFLSVAEAAAPHLRGPEQGSWLARLDADHANLLRAVRHAAADPDGTALVLRFGAAIDRYWAQPARREEAIGLLQPVLERPDAAADPPLYAAALFAAVEVAPAIATKLRFAQQMLQVCRRLGDDRLLSMALDGLCLATIFSTGERATGLAFGQEAVELARRLGDDQLMGECMFSYLLAIDPSRAVPLYAEAIACTERSGDHLCNAALHNNAGWDALLTGDIPAARAHLEAAAQANQQTGLEDTSGMANLGLLLRAEGDTDGSRSTLEAALRISRRSGAYSDMAGACLYLAYLAGDQGDWPRAGLLHGVAQAFLDRAGIPWDEDDADDRQKSLDQARAHLGDDQLEQARARGRALSLDQALDLALHGADPESQGLRTANRRDESPDDAR